MPPSHYTIKRAEALKKADEVVFQLAIKNEIVILT